MNKDELNKMDAARHLLPEPGSEVVGRLIGELRQAQELLEQAWDVITDAGHPSLGDWVGLPVKWRDVAAKWCSSWLKFFGIPVISAEILEQLDKAAENFLQGKVSEPINAQLDKYIGECELSLAEAAYQLCLEIEKLGASEQQTKVSLQASSLLEQIKKNDIIVKELDKRDQKLTALENAGVDNWEWYGDAMASIEEDDE